MSERDNKAIVSRLYEEVWNEGDLVAADELIAPDFVCHSSRRRGDVLDREGYKRYVGRLRTALNLRHTVEDVVAEGNTVAVRLTCRGEAKRLFGLIPGRRRFAMAGVVIWKLDDGRIMERRAIWGPA